MAPTVAGTEARDGIELMTQGLCDGAFRPGLSLTDNDILNGCFLQQMVNVPVNLFVYSKMPV